MSDREDKHISVSERDHDHDNTDTSRVPDPHVSEDETSDAESEDSDVQFEKESYDELVRTGGRPCYPIRLIDQVAKNPAAYSHITRP